MPWVVRKSKRKAGGYDIVNVDRNEIVGHSDTKEKALSSVRARYGAEKGWKATGKKRISRR